MIKPQRSVSILVVDDHPVVLGGVVTFLSQDKTFRLAASCTDAAEAIKLIRKLKPDLALVDMNMPGLNGLEILNIIVGEKLPTRVVFLAATLTDHEIVAATAGAHGIILKESAPDTLIACLHAVAGGEKWLSPELVNKAVERVQEHRMQIEKISHLLTPREMEIMLRVAEGLTNREVARQLDISEGTVKIHLHSIYQKVGVSNRTSLANFAIAHRDRLAAN